MKNTLTLISFILLSILVLSCEATDPGDPPEVRPPGYQEDIPWPSLAEGPWSMQKHDPQNTSRSKYVGASEGIIEKKIEVPYLVAVPVINQDNELFFISEQPPCTFGIISHYDTLQYFSVDETGVFTSPIIDKDGNVYVLGYFYLSKYNAKGELLWKATQSQVVLSLGLTMDKNGNIYYLVDNGTLKVVAPNGELLWEYNDSRILKRFRHLPAFSPDGNTLYIQGDTVSLLALDLQSRQIKWTFGSDELWSNPTVDSYGNIYIMPKKENYQDPGYLYCITPDGQVSWKYKIYKNIAHEVTINTYGDIVFGLEDTLYSIASNGKINWKIKTGKFIESEPIVDREGNIFFAEGQSISSVDINGNYRFTTPDLEGYYEQCLIDTFGQIITAPSKNKFIYIIK